MGVREIILMVSDEAKETVFTACKWLWNEATVQQLIIILIGMVLANRLLKICEVYAKRLNNKLVKEVSSRKFTKHFRPEFQKKDRKNAIVDTSEIPRPDELTT